MRILMISRDPNIFREGSAGAARHREYRALADDVQVISAGWGFLKTDWKPFSRFDLITAQDPFEAGVLGWVLSKWYRAPFQVQVHTDFLSPFYATESLVHRIRVSVARWVIRRASCVRVVSSRIERSLSAAGIASLDRITRLPILEEEKEEAILSSPPKDTRFQRSPSILMASRLTREKNIPLGLRAFKRILGDHPNAELVVVGDGPERKSLEAQVSELGLQKSVVFPGWQDSLGAYFASADLFLLSSDYEGYCLALLGAARAGCPIVTTDVGLVGDLLGPLEAGIVPPRDEDALVAELLKTLGDETLRASRKEKALLALEKLPSKQTYLENYKQSWNMCGKK